MRGLGPAAAVVVLGGIGFLSLRNPTGLWAGVAWTIAVCGLLGAVLLAVYRRGQTRAFWVGFAVFGWTYMVLSFDHQPFEFVEGCLLTTRAFDEVYLSVHHEPPPVRAVVDTWDLSGHKAAQQDVSTYYNFNQIHFRWAWHSLTALGAGAVGGLLAVWPRRPRDGDGRAPGPSLQFSISRLMLWVLAAGACIALLRLPCGLSLNLAFTTFGVALAWALLAAILGRGRRRAFGVGFAVFGWAYLLAAFGEFDVRLLVYGNNAAEGYLPTSRLFGELYPLVHPAPRDLMSMADAWNPSYHRPTKLSGQYLHSLNLHYFIRIGHSLVGLLAGFGGGMFAARIAGRDDEEASAIDPRQNHGETIR